MKPVLLFTAFCMMLTSGIQAQYLDFPGLGARELEEEVGKKARNEVLATAGAFAATTPTTVAEVASDSRINPKIYLEINYLEYSDVCTYYINPFKKIACQNKYNYLQQAHSQALELVYLPTINEINKGVREQIGHKYISIKNKIIRALDDMKNYSDKEFFYRKWLLGVR